MLNLTFSFEICSCEKVSKSAEMDQKSFGGEHLLLKTHKAFKSSESEYLQAHFFECLKFN